VCAEHVTCVVLFAYDDVVCVLSRFMPVGCGRPGPKHVVDVDKLYTCSMVQSPS